MRKHKSDRLIGILTILLLVVGLVVIYAIGPMRINYMNAAQGTNLDTNYYFVRQLINVAFSISVFFAAFWFPYEKMKKFSKWLLIGGLLACALLAILAAAGSSVAICSNGACRWIRLGGLGSIQPAEILKLGLVLFLAQLAAERKKTGKLNKSDFFLPLLVVSALSLLFVIVLQKDFGSGAVIVAIILAMIFMAGVDFKWLFSIFGSVLLIGVFLIVTSAHRMERVMTFLNGDGANNYHIENAEIAIGTGGLFGVGIGNSVQATGYLPESINDSVFAVMGETFGFLGLMAVIACFTVLLMRLMKIAEIGGEKEHRMIAVGMFGWIASQMVINIMAMTGLIPLTGITLPLLSYGGTSMLFIAAGLGVCLQLSCYTRRENSIKINKSGKGTRL